MAAGDIALRVLVSASTENVMSAFSGLSGLMGGIFKGISKGAGDIAFGLANMGNSGIRSFDAIKDGAKGLLLNFGLLLVVLAAVAAIAAVALGVVAVKAAADFQQGLIRLVTGAGDTTDNMQKMGQSILDVSVATGVTAADLNSAMYGIISENHRGADAINILRVAAEGAQSEQAKVVDVTRALTIVLKDYGTAQYNASQYMSGFIKAVQEGNLTLEQLSVSLSPILPLAHQYGISFADMAAAMATMTNAGIPAARAATSLRFAIQSIEVPTKKASDAMTHWGLDSKVVAAEMKKSLPDALQMIYNAAKKAGPEGSVPFNRALSDMTGGSRSLQGVLALTGGHLKDFKKNTQDVTDAMKGGKNAVLGWDVAQKGFNVQMDRGKAAVQALLINIGTALLPVLTKIVAAVTPIISAFADWVIKNNIVNKVIQVFGGILNTIGAVLGPVVGWFVMFVGILMRFGAALAKNHEAMQAVKNVLIAVGLIIGVVLAVALIAVMAIMAALAIAIGIVIAVVIGLQHAWAAMVGPLMTAWHGILQFFNGIVQYITGIVSFIVDLVTGHFNKLGGDLNQIVQGIVNIFQGGWAVISGIFLAAIGAIGGFIMGFVGAIVGFFQGLWATLVGHSIIPDMVMGILNWFGQLLSRGIALVSNLVAQAIMWFFRMRDQITAAVQVLVAALLQRFQNLVDQAVSTISGLAGRLGQFFSNLAGQAVQWGASIIQGLISGIQSMIGGITNAIGNIANVIASHLPHSPVKMGPLVGLENWGGTIVHMLATDMIAKTPLMANAARGLAGSVASAIQPGSGFNVGLSGGGNAFALTGGSSASGQGTMNLTIVMDGREITNVVGVRLARELRVQANVRK